MPGRTLFAAREDATGTEAPHPRELPPSPGRFIPDVEWSGGEMLVWGGIIPGADPNTVEVAGGGVRYDPSAR